MRWPVVFALALLVLGFGGVGSSRTAAAQEATLAASPTAAEGDFAGQVDIGGGRRLYLECRGEGGPTVVLEAGYRSPATVWSDDLVQPDDPRTMVLDGVAAFTRVCLYERPGVAAILDGRLEPSRSDPVPMPRPVEDVVADLHALLTAAEVPGPYVLVGHSFGGLMVRLYAATYPDEVVGMVLVDAWYEGLQNELTPEQWRQFLSVNALFPPEMAEYADYETIDFAAGSATMADGAATQPLPPLPLAVLARNQPLGVTEEVLGFSPDDLEQAWRRAEEGLARLTPDARFVVATESAHYVQLDQPDLVIEAVREVVDAVRDPSSWQTAVASPTASTPTGASSEPGDIEETPMPITGVEVRVLESDPVQVQADVEGYLSDGCTELGQITQRREGNAIEVTITVTRPTDAVCAEVITEFAETIPLEGEFPAGEYTLRVNDAERAFGV